MHTQARDMAYREALTKFRVANKAVWVCDKCMEPFPVYDQLRDHTKVRVCVCVCACSGVYLCACVDVSTTGARVHECACT